MSEQDEQVYIETRLQVPRNLADSVGDFITEHIAAGLVLEEEEDSPVTGIIFYVPEDDTQSRERLTEFLEGLVGNDLSEIPEIVQRSVGNASWVEKYRESIRPVTIGEDVAVRPTWCEPTGLQYEIVIDPNMAFGTGSHATTKGSLLGVRNAFKEGMSFMDMGTGSGVLAVLADKMGASRIKAIDYDIVAIENCRENFELNKVRASHEILLGSIEKCDGDDPYDFVCANIIRSTILSMLDRLIALTRRGGVLVLSGLLELDEPAISEALQKYGQADFDIFREEGWLTYTLRVV